MLSLVLLLLRLLTLSLLFETLIIRFRGSVGWFNKLFVEEFKADMVKEDGDFEWDLLSLIF
jgi:hypothetical protein